MSSMRERLRALRPGSAADAPAPAIRVSPARDGGPGGPERRLTRRPCPEWDLEGERLAQAMDMLGVLGKEAALSATPPQRLLFLDLETTGLSLGAGTLAFLVGMAWLEDGPSGRELVIEQWMLRALAQEKEMLSAARARLEDCAALVTYNGKSYDLPLLEGRCVLARVGPPAARPHLDALHPARRLLSHALPDVRLVTLERALWGESRPDDLPGAAMPAAFFASLRGDDALLEDILRHNADDLATLARLPPLLAHLASGGHAPTGLGADGLVLADLRLRSGRRDDALRALETCRTLPGSPRALRRARLTKRVAGAAAAREHWLHLCRSSRTGVEPFEELAKLLEHRERDCQGALDLVEQALRRCGGDVRAQARLEHRRDRLLRKLHVARAFPGEGVSG